MDEPATEVATDPPIPDGPLRRYRSWATVLFTILAFIGLLGVAIVVAAGQGVETIVLLGAATTAVLGIAVFAAAALGLDRRAAWAIHAVQPLCLVLIVTGLVRSGLALAESRIDIPLEVIGALMVLSRDHRPELLPAIDPRGHRTMSLVVGLAIVVQVLPILDAPLRQGALFGAPEEALALDLEIDCDPAPATDTPAVARLSWSWASDEPFPPEVDGVRIEWSESVGGDPASEVFLAGERVSDPDHITQSGGAEDALVALDVGAHLGVPNAIFRIDQPDAGPLDGWVEVDLAPADPAVTTGALGVIAWYAHGGRWVKMTGAADCLW